MQVEKAKQTFGRRLKQGGDLSALSLAEGVNAMLEFYREVRARGCDIAQDGDMLLFQWGTYDWGDGEHFEFDITRQFIEEPGADEDIWQLSLTFRFAPEESLRALGSGNRWCHSPQELEPFVTFIRSTAAYTLVVEKRLVSVSLDYFCVG
jgi:hypothetical protein